MSNYFDQYDAPPPDTPAASNNYFDQYDPPPAQAPAAPTNYFDKFDAPPPQQPLPEAEGKLATAGRELAHGVIPGAAGAYTGMLAGAALGSAVPVLGTLAGGVIGGLGGGLLGGYAASTVQEKALNALGFDDSLQRAVNAKENPWSSAGGAAASAIAGGGPGALTRAAAPGVAAITGKQALGIRAASGAIGGGFEAGSQLAQGEELDPTRIAATAAGGAAFAKPYNWGNQASAVGENLGARWRDRPRAQPHGPAGPEANASTAAEPPPTSKQDVGFENPIGEGSGIEYSKPRDSATGDNTGVGVRGVGELDLTLKAAVDADNPPAQPKPPPEAAAPPPEAAVPPPVAEPPQGVTSGPPVTPRVAVDPETGQMRMPKPKLTKAEQAAVDIDANAKARVMAREGQKSFPKEPTPEMTPVSRETMELANQIEATGRPDATAFADSMRGAAHNNRVRPEAIDFYKQKLTDFQARAGEAAAGTKPVENFSIRDIIEPKQVEQLDAHMKDRSTPEKTALSDILQEAHVRSSELVKRINDAGWKVRDVIGGTDVPPEIKAAKQELSMLGGQVARLLGGLKPRKGRDVGARMGADMATLRKDLDAGKITSERQTAPEQTTLKPAADDLDIPSFLDRRTKPAPSEALRQDVLERGRSGRPIETERLPIGSEEAILEAGMAKATGPKGEPREPEMLAARRKGPKDPDAPDAAIDAATAKATEAIDRATANKVANQLGARVKKAIELGVTPESLKAHASAILDGKPPPPLEPITMRGWVKGEPLPPSAARGTPSVTSPVGGGVPPGGTAQAAAGGAGAPPPTPPGGTPPIPPNVGAAAAAGAGGGGGPTTPNMGHTPPQQQSWLKELWRDVKRKTAAHTLGPEAMEARYLIRSSSGEKHRLAEQTIDLIRGHKDHIDPMSSADHAALIDHAQGGNHFPNFQPTAEQKLYLRDRERSMQEWEAVLHQLPAADQMQFREKFMAHMYENPQAAGGRVFTGMGKRGSAGSTKHRKYDTYMDAEAAGLIRKYNNPIEIDSRYINSIKDFVISRDVVQRGADAGIIQWFDNPKIIGASGSPEPKVTGGPPPGMKELNGVPMKGNSKTAYAPDDFADVYNNFYDKGFGTTPEKATVVEAVRNSANAWTSLELGLNAYHLFTMANEAIITDLTKGFNNILVGQVRKGLKQIAMSPLAPETMRREGKIFQKEYLDPNSTNPIAMILAEANARPIGRGHAADYTFQERGAFINKLSNIEGQLKQARKEIGEDFNKAFGPNATESKILFPLRQAGRILQTTAAPIFDKYIPMLKAGAVHSQFKDWHEAMVAKNPAFDMVNNPADRRTAVNAGMKIVDSVDNRFGEAIHDNAFMNGMLKQGLMTMMRSYSWTVGAMKEIGGGSAAAGQALYTLGKTRGAENRFDMTHKDWDPRMAYPLALTFAVSTISTIYQMLRAGEAPEGWRDLYAPKTGGTVPGVGGKGMVKEHVLMPGYQKDVLGWAMHPAQEAYNKMGGLPTTAIEQLTGKDWRGDPIVRADANALEGFGQRLGHVLGKLSPISVKNMTKGSEPTSAITWPEKAIGFRAPGAHIQDPVGLKRAMDFKDRRIQKAIDKRERKIQLRQNPQVSP